MRPLKPDNAPLQMELESVILGTLSFSPQVNVMREVAPLHEDAIVEAAGRFRPARFRRIEVSRYQRSGGQHLDVTGSPDRYIDQNWYYSNGIRKRTLTGAQIELSQKIGYENSNSLYFLPDRCSARNVADFR